MCHNKYQRSAEYTYQRSHRRSGFWGMPLLPFLIAAFFIFGLHSLPFVAHAWEWMLPLAIGFLFFAKAAGTGGMFRQSLRTKEEPSLRQPEGEYTQLYQQVYYQAPVQETYHEGGRQFRYPRQELQVQQSSYEEPGAQYPQNMPPVE